MDATPASEQFPETRLSENHNTDDIFAEARAHLPVQDAQRGVQDMEAITLTWSKQSLVAVFILYVA